MKIVPTAILLTFLSLSLRAELWLPALFSDGMIVQREKPFTLWGKDTPGTKITVTLAGTSDTATVTKQGTWKATLPVQSFTQSQTLTIQGSTTLEIKEVLVGEVWIASGQSNMEYSLRAIKADPRHLSETADRPIRFFRVKRNASAEPVEDVTGSWGKPTDRYSAVAFYFAQSLYAELNVPVGIIQSGWSGSPIRGWIPFEILEPLPPASYQVRKFKEFMALDPSSEVYSESIKSYKPHGRPGYLFNGMIHPIAGFPAKGIIWYQGESDINQPYGYTLFCQAMLKAWREAWQDPTLGFFPVQLAGYKDKQTRPSEGTSQPQFREAQIAILNQPYTGAATAVDVGEADNIHPPNKQPVGHRLATSTLHVMYGRDDLPAGSPRFEKLEIIGSEVILTLKDIGNGLKLQPNGAHSGFAVKSESGDWEWADIKSLNGNQVIIQSAAVENPAEVRYGWARNPCLSIFSADDFPLLPFRTDKTPYRDRK
ncbi:sialate O-acetylesterase [Kiritimatiellaeota bacterium B1221]|nr:sialate O-acetylesterase [Kiritimatiellaeota bacterium B1221]